MIKYQKKYGIWLGVLVAIVLLAALTMKRSRPEPPQPVYKGQPLSYWVQQLPARLVFTDGDAETFPVAYTNAAEAKADLLRLEESSAEGLKAVR